MDEVKAYTAAFVLIALSLPLVSYGTMNDITAAWTVGFAALVAAAIIPIVVRYAEPISA